MAEAQDVLKNTSSFPGDIKSSRDDDTQLADITAQATLKYSVRDYDAAAELYSQATELQAEINGEMSPENAELLYEYGRCLYHVAVKNSDVLGSKVAGVEQNGSKEPVRKKMKKTHPVDALDGQEKKVTEEVLTKVVEGKDGPIHPENESKKGNKPYFQFTGDDNWDPSEDEEDEDARGNEDGAEADEEDDFVNAYEVLDLARVLLLKEIEEAEKNVGKKKEESQENRQLRERLADTYDLQAEISLEGERFPNAVVDLKSALELKTALFPQESSIIAEAHYKLSLALEFSSVTQQKDVDGEIAPGTGAQVDEAMREEAAEEMEAAIASCRLRIQKEEVILSDDAPTNGDSGKPKVTKRDIEDVKEMVKEMEQRLVELRQPPVSVNDPTGMSTIDGSNPLSGVLGSLLGETPAAQKARLEDASKDAKDLTNLVKRKRPAEKESSRSVESDIPQIGGQGKAWSAEQVGGVRNGKRLRTSNGGK